MTMFEMLLEFLWRSCFAHIVVLFLFLSKWPFSLNFVWRRIVYICRPLITDTDTSPCPVAKSKKKRTLREIYKNSNHSFSDSLLFSLHILTKPQIPSKPQLTWVRLSIQYFVIGNKNIIGLLSILQVRDWKPFFILIWLIYRICIFFVSIWILLTYYSHILKQN